MLAQEMKRQAPAATGQLRESIEVRKASKFSFTIGARAPHAKFVEQGRSAGATAPPLRGTRFRRWLSSKGIGPRWQFAVARSIGRKGIPPRPFQQRAFELLQGKMFRELIKDFQKLVSRTRGR